MSASAARRLSPTELVVLFASMPPAGSHAMHQAIEDNFVCALASADMPSTKEPNSIFTADNKRPDGLTLLLGGRQATGMGRNCYLSID